MDLYDFFKCSTIICWASKYTSDVQLKDCKFNDCVFTSSCNFFKICLKKSNIDLKTSIILMNLKDSELMKFNFQELLTSLKSIKQFYITHITSLEPWLYIKERRLAFLKLLSYVQKIILENKMDIGKSFNDVEDIIQHYNMLKNYKVNCII